MITLYSGTPGSGKSLHVAKTIYEYLQGHYDVIANFDIDLNAIKRRHGNFLYLPNNDMTPEFLIEYSASVHAKKGGKVKEGRIVLVIDEAQLMFNSREWQKSGRFEWSQFFTQHRKYKYDIILISQFDRMIDKQIRSLIEYEFKHRKCTNFGIAGKAIGLLSMGTLFCAVEYWYPVKQKIMPHFFKVHKKYFRIYDTYKLFGDGVAGSAPATGAGD